MRSGVAAASRAGDGGGFTPAPPHRRGGRLDLVQLLFNGAGRIGRRAYLLALVPPIVAGRLAIAAPAEAAWALWLLALAMASAVVGKRLHDVSRAGWWAAAPFALLALAVRGEAPTDLAQRAALAVGLAVLAALALAPGERRFNRFGPPPGGERGGAA